MGFVSLKVEFVRKLKAESWGGGNERESRGIGRRRILRFYAFKQVFWVNTNFQVLCFFLMDFYWGKQVALPSPEAWKARLMREWPWHCHFNRGIGVLSVESVRNTMSLFGPFFHHGIALSRIHWSLRRRRPWRFRTIQTISLPANLATGPATNPKDRLSH